VQRAPDRSYQWISPTGQTYDKPPDELPKDTTLEVLPDDDPPPF
jgi:hypothetical protein